MFAPAYMAETEFFNAFTQWIPDSLPWAAILLPALNRVPKGRLNLAQDAVLPNGTFMACYSSEYHYYSSLGALPWKKQFRLRRRIENSRNSFKEFARVAATW